MTDDQKTLYGKTGPADLETILAQIEAEMTGTSPRTPGTKFEASGAPSEPPRQPKPDIKLPSRTTAPISTEKNQISAKIDHDKE